MESVRSPNSRRTRLPILIEEIAGSSIRIPGVHLAACSIRSLRHAGRTQEARSGTPAAFDPASHRGASDKPSQIGIPCREIVSASRRETGGGRRRRSTSADRSWTRTRATRAHWRQVAEAAGQGFILLDPMRRNFKDREVDSANEIVEFDLQDVRDADILLVNYSKSSIGTSMEVFFAVAQPRQVRRGVLALLVQGLQPVDGALLHQDPAEPGSRHRLHPRAFRRPALRMSPR